MKSDRREKFVELAENRTNKALAQIKLIGNLSNRSNYIYSEEDVRKIYRALKGALDEMKTRFANNGDDFEKKFKL